MTIRLVVDSSSDLSQARGAELGLTVVPLSITFGEETFQDGIDLDSATFYSRLVQSQDLPKTAMPNAGQFADAYERLVREGATEILSIHVSTKFSGTFNAARTAAEMVQAATGVPITPVDSGVVSAAIALPVVRAAEQVKAGASSATVLALMHDMWARGRIFILLDTLEYLERGGRIGRAQAVFGAMLNIKPILTIRDGEVASLERIRTRGKALNRVSELLATLEPIADLSIVASDPETAKDFIKIARERYNGPIERVDFGPVVGTYAGPRSGGIFCVPVKAQ